MLLQEPKSRPWSKAEYHQAAELGWFDGQRVELINGGVIDMPPQRKSHAMGILLADRAVRAAFGSGFVFRCQLPLAAPGASEPEPDLAVVQGSIEEMKHHPSTAALVIEIAESTLEYDRTRKAGLYARCKVADYWIVNLIDRQLEVRRNIVSQRGKEFGWDYSTLAIYNAGEAVASLVRPRAKIKVADLLP
jgi:Uma2 family endonuclease